MYPIIRLTLLFSGLLGLAGCNPAGHVAGQDFSAAGPALGAGKIGSGAKDIGLGFSNGANATGQAIASTAQKIGQAFQQ